MNAVGIIPARWASTRFPGKVLAALDGRPLLQHVWERAKQCRLLDEVFIACDDEGVFKAARDFGAEVVMTSKAHSSGTDRIAEAVGPMDVRIIVNIQGDEPLISPEAIDSLTKCLSDNDDLEMATVIRVLSDPQDLSNPNIVKVVINQNDEALYFSRAPIPFDRDQAGEDSFCRYKHFGIYAYRKDFLLKFSKLPISPLEKIEKLEQLRALEAGFIIKTIKAQCDSVGVDTPEDLERVEKILKNSENT